MKTSLTIASLLALSSFAPSQVPQKAVFEIRVTKKQRVKDGCTVLAESATVRFTISSEQSGACGMLRAGEMYRAFRAGTQADADDSTKDSTFLVIYNKDKDMRGSMGNFDIDSEEVKPKAAK